MNVATGKSIINKIAIGKIRYQGKKAVQAPATSKRTPQEELERFEKAREKAGEQLHALYENALREVGEDNAAIYGEMLGFDEAKLAELKEKGVI